MPFNRDEDDDDLFDSVSAMADRMQLKGEKRATYIDDHMMQGGYQRVQSRESYARMKQEGEEGDGGGSRWGFGRGRESGGRGRNRGDESDDF